MPQINTLLLALAFVAHASALPKGIKPKPPPVVNMKELGKEQMKSDYGRKVQDKVLQKNLEGTGLLPRGGLPPRKDALVPGQSHNLPNLLKIGNAQLKKEGHAYSKKTMKNTKKNGLDGGLAVPSYAINKAIQNARGKDINTVAMKYPGTKGNFFTPEQGLQLSNGATAKVRALTGRPNVQFSSNVDTVPNQLKSRPGRHRRGEMPSLGLPPKQAAVAASSAPLPFPVHWGPAPRTKTKDIVQWPGDYGKGSGTIRNWIVLKMTEDKDATLEKAALVTAPAQSTQGQPATTAAVAAPPASRAPHPWVAAATPTGGNAAGDEVVLEEDLAFELFFEGALTEEEAAVISQILNEASAAGEMDIELGGKTFQPTAEVLTMPAAAFYAEHPEFAASAVDDAAAGSKSNAGAIAAAVVALLVLMVAVVGSVAMYLKKRRSTTTAAYAATIDTTAPAVALTTTAVAHGGAGALPYPCLSI